MVSGCVIKNIEIRECMCVLFEEENDFFCRNTYAHMEEMCT